jgi:hypothetical protein
MGSLDRFKTYLTALYLKFYAMLGVIFLPFAVLLVTKGAPFNMSELPLAVLYLVILTSSVFDDKEAVSQELKKIANNRTPRTRRNEIILYAVLFAAYTLLVFSPGGIFGEPIKIWEYVLGAALIIASYLLRPSAFRLK